MRDVFVVDAPAWNATWAAFLVVAIVAWMLGAWLLPALGIRPTTNLRFVSDFTPLEPDALQPEPLEQQRYLLTMLAALVVVPCAFLIARRRGLDVVTRFAPALGLLAVLVVGTVAFVRGYHVADRYFAMGPVLGTVVVVVLGFGISTLFARGSRALVVAADRLSQRRAGEVVALAVALLVAAGVVSVGIYSDGQILLSAADTGTHVQFTFEEATAVFYGHTPLVDFTPQYSALLGWLLAPLYFIFTPTLQVFTVTMAVLGVVALACLYFTFRLVTGSAARALLLYLPPIGIGFVVVQQEPGWNVHTIAGYFALMPIRELGPLALGLATVAVVGAARSRRNAILLGAGAAATVLFNVEFGLFAAAGAVLAAAMLNDDPRPVLRRTGVLAGELLAGGVAVLVAFTLLTLVRSGSLPDFGQLFYFQRQFAAAGFFMLPLSHLLDLHTLVFATCAAAVIAGFGIAAFGRVRPGVHGRRSAALLIFAGVFGFGAFAYYMGRTHPDVLSATFLPWAIALMALCWESGCRLAAGGITARAIRPAAAVLLAGATLLGVVGVRHLNYTVHQPARITGPSGEFALYGEDDVIAAARRCLPRGTNALILTDMPDLVARAAHVRSWFAYADPGSVVTAQQVDRVFDVADRHHVTAVVNLAVQSRVIASRGYTLARRYPFAYNDVATIGSYSGTTTIWVKPGTRLAC